MSTARQRLTMLAAGVAVAALAGSSGAVAAGMITGDDIKNNTVRSSDIMDGTLRSKDLREGLLGLIREGAQPGPQGEQGEPGAPGPAGPQGPAGPTANVDALTARVAALEAQMGPLLIAANCAYDFPAQKMWEVSWGRSFAERDEQSLFTPDSFGGLTHINGQLTDWNDDHLYPAAPVNHRVITYRFADLGANNEITVTIDPDANGCPVIVWSGVPTP